MAKKAKAKKAVAGLPAGFSQVEVGGSFGAWWDHTKQKILTGDIVGMDTITQKNPTTGKKEKRRILRVKQPNGITATVGESYALRELFDIGKKLMKRKVYLRFDGQKKLPGRKKLNQFTVALG